MEEVERECVCVCVGWGERGNARNEVGVARCRGRQKRGDHLDSLQPRFCGHESQPAVLHPKKTGEKIKNEKKDRERIRNNHKKEKKIELIEIEEYV